MPCAHAAAPDPPLLALQNGAPREDAHGSACSRIPRRAARPAIPCCPRPAPRRVVSSALLVHARPRRPCPYLRAQSKGHTIILLQSSDAVASRTYLDFETQGKALDAIVRMFEDRLRALTPGARNITYDVEDLYRYLDNLTDISALTCVPRAGRRARALRRATQRTAAQRCARRAAACARRWQRHKAAGTVVCCRGRGRCVGRPRRCAPSLATHPPTPPLTQAGRAYAHVRAAGPRRPEGGRV
jgi:hypothetical protein